MARYVLRVFRDNVTGWVPTILVVAVVTTLVGICMNQFVWTSSPSFTLAARQAVVPEFLRTLVFARPRGDDQFADCTFSPSLDMSR